MISLLPTTACFNGKEYEIRNAGNWYDIYRCICAFNDNDLDDADKWYAAGVIFFPQWDEIEDYEQAMEYIKWFIDCGESTNEDIPKFETSKNGINVSFFQDMDLMIDSLNATKDRDIRNTYLHWWTFVGDMRTIEPRGQFKTILEIRYKLQNGIKLDKFDRQFYEEHKNRIILNTKNMKDTNEWLDGDE